MYEGHINKYNCDIWRRENNRDCDVGLEVGKDNQEKHREKWLFEVDDDSAVLADLKRRKKGAGNVSHALCIISKGPDKY